MHLGQIDRVVLDEAHLPFSTFEGNFRTNLINLRKLFSSAPCLFLSATVPPSLLDKFCDYYNISHIAVIRAPTNRPNIEYSVIRCGPAMSMVGTVLQENKEFIGSGRVIIYCRSKAMANEIGEKFQVLVYHADRPDEARVETARKFLSGEDKVVAATGSLGEQPAPLLKITLF